MITVRGDACNVLSDTQIDYNSNPQKMSCYDLSTQGQCGSEDIQGCSFSLDSSEFKKKIKIIYTSCPFNSYIFI